MDAHLDGGSGKCQLRQPEIAQIVAGALRFFDGERYELKGWVVMPNHVHVLVWLTAGHSLSAILHSWKSYSAHEIKKRSKESVAFARQKESYEHLIRDAEDLHGCCEYTIMNPVNARLCEKPEEWKWSSAYRP